MFVVGMLNGGKFDGGMLDGCILDGCILDGEQQPPSPDDQHYKKNKRKFQTLENKIEKIVEEILKAKEFNISSPPTRSTSFVDFYNMRKGNETDVHYLDPLPKDFKTLHPNLAKECKYVTNGLQSTIFSTSFNGTQSIIKLYKDNSDKIVESVCLERLNSVDGVPRIIFQGDSWIVLQPQGVLIDSNAPWSVFVEAHQLGLVHRDIRPSNIIISNADNTPILIDWAAAVQKDTQDHYVGTLYTASFSVLDSLDIREPHFSTIIDDLVAFVKTIIIIRFKFIDDLIHQIPRTNPSQLKSTWKRITKTLLDPYYRKLLSASHEGNYEKIYQLLCDGCDHQHHDQQHHKH
ncbi:hypothetical protein PPL_00722 [Heterostelium album PN500]|uniref:Non-specific serine/threonine protein kinase n=1 Tax=Heterostelium pallidum (strain ATCC 26659 / Pp 5 / PN500) TaxID=670386 RepID=D3AX91_HETP5|nr:hypothetical protein PPL_00722 [Heterostelium album PN500]EFA86160.1 hypothetical protein PPL_00722 [Heterostelium album PN500]|eukprot:XP_020438265.1 hypothetical protein PPL_00722 [Heterostelium album PN500]